MEYVSLSIAILAAVVVAIAGIDTIRIARQMDEFEKRRDERDEKHISVSHKKEV